MRLPRTATSRASGTEAAEVLLDGDGHHDPFHRHLELWRSPMMRILALCGITVHVRLLHVVGGERLVQ
jgi:hypothetical protein